ncbi:cbb3-type cytochrome c oxidase subunit I [Tuwongella immobilis]|uniref:Cytochrome oxidase subunit I profile domain-containing protein n=1 Tax=Tuwongella immobilis TaxID=692036 RepID=A0A6C2YMY0_9BACT|nr:cbb3-type cytochrome c oxidase subunit I [Tuwongella immobilis]VIP02796.1 membrane protein : Cytochrome-c oxidase OS=Isosphaera pallida (strain ATCC 43644 / DSM 9630 / IS1B) GN=Isop_0396 PE=4 SV=1: COX1 [Tuwongella immobilis]VTS02476.1 membrane protein : Cytochrome-c oxidase OS=Isosphaera pallida (strain ATCC 43644 / DSM 9630 / IS1B) GN=Isop_0396 PE=4 SV=1: COX1 [Tuwongella immobilis]
MAAATTDLPFSNGTVPEDTAAQRRAFAMERARLDASTRGPVLTFFSFAVFWLVLGSIFGLITSLKFHTYWILGDSPWLTAGRLRPAHLNSVAYGWGSNAGIGAILWLVSRLTRAEMVLPKVLYLSAGLWNLGVLIGTVGILAGYSTSVEWLEYPKLASPFLVSGLLLVSLWSIATFQNRREKHVYVTLWYCFGAVFWMPWLYTVASFLIIWMPATGVVQATTNWWFAHNVLGLWLTPIGLGAAYYLIPKVIGRPIYSYYLSIVGFWALALFYSWAGMHHLVGGPLPAWMVSASVVGSMMMFIPVMAVALNHHMTMIGNFQHLRYSPTLRFVVFGAMAYTVTSFQGSVEALRSFSEIAHFTHYTVGHAHLGAYGFYSMIMFGTMYYAVPRLTGWEWGSPTLIRIHFWTTAIGITIYFTGLTIGGWYQGLAMNLDSNIPFMRTVLNTVPYLWSRSLGGSLMTIGHIVFAVLFVMNICRLGSRRQGPTYFRERETAQPATASI